MGKGEPLRNVFRHFLSRFKTFINDCLDDVSYMFRLSMKQHIHQILQLKIAISSGVKELWQIFKVNSEICYYRVFHFENLVGFVLNWRKNHFYTEVIPINTNNYKQKYNIGKYETRYSTLFRKGKSKHQNQEYQPFHMFLC